MLMLVNYSLHHKRYATQTSIARSSLSLTHPLAKLTRMMLKSVDKRLSKTDRELWQRQAWFMAKRIEDDNKSCYAKHHLGKKPNDMGRSI